VIVIDASALLETLLRTSAAGAVEERRDADDLAQRVQRIVDDPTRETDERDDRVLQALYQRRELEV
jgi:hypothetical protein